MTKDNTQHSTSNAQRSTGEGAGGSRGFEGCDSRRLVALMELGSGEEGVGSGSLPVGDGGEVAPRVEGYEIVGQLGQGGMGVVWRAVQSGTRREVALKVLPGWSVGTGKARRRFEREVELSARLEHPAIARVYESGVSGGLDYCAMELVEGVHLDRYVREKGLGVREIVALMREVCGAVEYAHRRGVIHRDIKPSNVLVTGDGRPHVVDFGLAKAVEEAGGVEGTMVTREGQATGTLAFMSPEQAAGKLEQVDTRSDVYGLGATLYLLLTGETVHDMRGPQYEVVRRVASEEARRPRGVKKDLPAELEWLLLRALAQDPERRYSSAGEMGEDIARYLRGEALVASPVSAGYRVRKFVWRHRLVIGVAVGVAGLLVGAAVVSVGMAVRATEERRRADEQAAVARAVNEFLNFDLLSQANVSNQMGPDKTQDRNLTVREALDRAARRIGGRFVGQPGVEAAIRRVIGESYGELGVMGPAEEQLKEAVRLTEVAAGGTGAVTTEALAARHGLGVLAARREQWGEAKRMLSEVYEERRKLLGETHADTLRTLRSLGQVHMGLRDWKEAEGCYRRGLEGQRATLGARHRDTVMTMAELGGVYLYQGRNSEAAGLLKEALEAGRAVMGREHNITRTTQAYLGAALAFGEGKWGEAEPLFKEVAEWGVANGNGWGPSAEEVVPGLVACYVNLGNEKEAEAWSGVMREVMGKRVGVLTELCERRTGEPGAMVGLLKERAGVYARLGRWSEAGKDLEGVLAVTPDDYRVWAQLGAVRAEEGDVAGYRGVCEEMLKRFGGTEDASVGDQVAKVCLIRPGAVGDVGKVNGLAEMAVGKGLGKMPYYRYLVKGMAEYRAGKFESAAGWLEKSRGAFSEEMAKQNAFDRHWSSLPEGRVTASYLIAMAEWGMGRKKQARTTYEGAREEMRLGVPGVGTAGPRVGKMTWLIADVVGREAEGVVGGKPGGEGVKARG